MATTSDIAAVTGEYVLLDGEDYYRIANSHLMPEFFMSLVGASDHWMFVSSHGALTAGRRNSDLALFPYAADDQISAARGDTGAATLIRIESTSGWDSAERGTMWEPFATHSTATDRYRCNLYKTAPGNKVVFEEINESHDLVFRYRWAFSEKFGFVRSCRLENTGSESCSLEILDGLRNILPHGITAEFQSRYSNLGNAYKKNELLLDLNVGLFYLSSVPTDRAEPSEGLRATTVWQSGPAPNAILLSSEQLQSFRDGRALHTETDVRGKAGAFLLNHCVDLAAGDAIEWQIVADVAQDHSDVVGLVDWLQHTPSPSAEVADEIQASEQSFLRIVSSADAMQCSANQRRCNRHLSNTVFNVMRGGIPLENYDVHTDDFAGHVASFNRQAFERNQSFLSNLPAVQNAIELRRDIADQNDADLLRLGLEYLPLAFSRRHGDPTRPWNQFSIDLRSDDGRTNLNYQGNWRDIFQNWEALGVSFPELFPSMICRFVNATTADGYNPYRLTKNGFEWEEAAADDPWANIGYWGDHQIVYLLRLLEWSRRFQPQNLDTLLHSRAFVYANVPYHIRSYDDIRKDARDTIEFDTEMSAVINERVTRTGADGKLLRNQQNEIHYVTLIEKLLTLSLAKLSNFIPDGGIWLNTQRPEWNDANNALVGNGLSMVTTCYLYRWFQFLSNWISSDTEQSIQVSSEVAHLLQQIDGVLREHTVSVSAGTDPKQRREIVDALSQAGSDYRQRLYETGLSGKTTALPRQSCLEFFENARRHLEATIRNNKREDGLYHSYNLIAWQDDSVEIEHLYEMLEGQVAVLSSGLLTSTEVVQLLDTLRQSSLFRANQNSYLLYPDRQLPRFMDKNQIDTEVLQAGALLQVLLHAGDESIVKRDVHGGVHFHATFRNSSDLREALDNLDSQYDALVHDHGTALIETYDELFGHRRFTGRSGTFFAYEGLGSIYWHMVSKLALAVSENVFQAIENGASRETIDALKSHLSAIRAGIGAEKSPAEYGAFPSDPYSHTPENAGVKQPGMTGQVKEDVLARFAEIGIHIEDGCACLRLDLFDRSELLPEASELRFYDLAGEFHTVSVPANGFGFTLFQVPFIYQPGDADTVRVYFTDGSCQSWNGLQIDRTTSQELFSRSGKIIKIECEVTAFRKSQTSMT